FRLGRNLLALSLDPHRHLRQQTRDHELRFPLYRAGHRFGAGRPGRGLDARRRGKLVTGLLADHFPGWTDGVAGALCAEVDAESAPPRPQPLTAAAILMNSRVRRRSP